MAGVLVVAPREGGQGGRHRTTIEALRAPEIWTKEAHQNQVQVRTKNRARGYRLSPVGWAKSWTVSAGPASRLRKHQNPIERPQWGKRERLTIARPQI